MRVVVIGAGLLGICSAWYLAQRGARVTVLESAAEPAGLTSHANGGMLTPSQAMPWNEPGVAWKVLRTLGREDSAVLLRPRALPSLGAWLPRFLFNSAPARFRANAMSNARLAIYSLDCLRELQAILGRSCELAWNGTMKVFADAAALDLALGWSRMLAGTGVRHRLLDAHAAIALEPALAPGAGRLAGAIHYPDDASGDARGFCHALAGAAVARGVAFRFDTPATVRIDHRSGLCVVHGGGERLPADACVLACGHSTARLARTLGLKVPVRPVKGYSLTVPTGTGAPSLPIVDETWHVAATPLGDRLRIAGTAEFAGEDLTLSAGRIENLRRFVRARFPDLQCAAGEDHPWCGLRPMSCDGVPLIGPTSIRNLYLNAGHGHLGWTLCAGSGRLLADLMSGGVPGLDAAPYAPARFG
ncbi:MAG: FAD-dependent oxidoreductase [Gammaproteobacteria bacterium]